MSRFLDKRRPLVRRQRSIDIRISRHVWVFLGPLLLVLAYVIGLALFDLLGAGYLRGFARRIFGM